MVAKPSGETRRMTHRPSERAVDSKNPPSLRAATPPGEQDSPGRDDVDSDDSQLTAATSHPLIGGSR